MTINKRTLPLIQRFILNRWKSKFASPLEVERAEWIFYLQHLREGMVVFDVGANIGELTLLFSRFVGNRGQVHSFEANTKNFKQLEVVSKSATHKNVILNHLALAEKEGFVDLHLYDDEHSSWSSLADRPFEKYGIQVKTMGIEKVPGTTIDAYCEKEKIPYINILKIDVEGAEYQVLLGARRMLEGKRILCCIFEFGQTTFDMGNDPSQLEAYLKGLGYRIRNVVKGNPIFPGRSSVETACFSMHIAMPKV